VIKWHIIVSKTLIKNSRGPQTLFPFVENGHGVALVGRKWPMYALSGALENFG